jgi:ring-1,2-phenylacetyl-CoA epoxidase subunit PaaD
VVSAYDVAATVHDPELPMLTLADLGILRDVIDEGERVVVTITPTYSGCPAMAEIRADLHRALRGAGYEDVDVRTVLTPPWTSDDITAHGRATLAAHGIAPPHRRSTLVTITPRPACPQCGSPDATRLSAFGATACRDLHRCNTCREPFEQVKTI